MTKALISWCGSGGVAMQWLTLTKWKEAQADG
jgi:hypothetical protein